MVVKLLIALLVIFSLSITFLVYCCLVVGSRSDDNIEKEGEDHMDTRTEGISM